MSMDQLMKFRMTYLRAIARAWANEEFRVLLTTTPIVALRQFGFNWPWTKCDLTITDARFNARTNDSTCKPNGPPDDSPNEFSLFEWVGNKWIWSPDMVEGLTLYVPLMPRQAIHKEGADYTIDLPTKRQARALADYYSQSKTLFSDEWAQEEKDSQNTSAASEFIQGALSSFKSRPNVRNQGDFIPTDEWFASFDVALLAALSRAWNDRSFLATLMIDAPTALQSIQGYKAPWKIAMFIRNDPKAAWHFDAKDEKSQWDFKHNHHLQLYLPGKPQDEHCEAVALAMYNATGAEYPFTCTC